MIFSTSAYLNLKKRLKAKYQKELFSVSNKLPLSLIGSWSKKNQKLLGEYSPQHWFLLTEIKKFTFLHSINISSSNQETELSSEEDQVFELWNKSEFADVFLKQLNKGKSIAEASAFTLAVMDKHLLAMAQKITGQTFNKKDYRPQVGLGDGKKLSSPQKKNIGKALEIIKEFSPDSYLRFQTFTDTIYPIDQQEFVSYSHQELPGTSMINLYDRDFVDLLDDLLHENGHHHLNYYLNLGKLIDEPIDLIYYSPWRRTLRPIRGIYHAYFTFFWAFKLFSDLALKLDETSFTAAQKDKILGRAIEEYYMLNYSFADLKWAKKAGLINKSGWKLIEEQSIYLAKHKKNIVLWEKQLKKKKELNLLKKNLIDARKKYRLKSI